MAFTFKGGIRIEDYKHTAKCRTQIITDPQTVRISMKQSAGESATPTVKTGDTVKIGQMIGNVCDDVLGCPVHASVSGNVVSIDEITSANGETETFVTIENDGKNDVSESVIPFTRSITETSREEITDIIRRAGIVGLGGGAYPTYAKINTALGKSELLIVNCAESEPFVTSDHRLLLEETEKVIGGIKILMRAVGAPRTIIAVEDNKINVKKKLDRALGNCDFITTKLLKNKYPQGNERLLVFALTGREIATGKLPTDAGCVVFNPSTCAAVYTAFAEGMPLVRRIVTVSGDCLRNPGNFSVPVGTSADFLIKQAGGLKKTPQKLIFGSPMRGQALSDAEVYTKKNTSALLLLSDNFGSRSTDATCIRCGRCMTTCPMRLIPANIAAASMKKKFDFAEKSGAMSCVECGTCAYGCPGKVDLVRYIREAKDHIRAKNDQLNSAAEHEITDK